MARHLARRGMPMQADAAAITVSTTLQTFSQIALALRALSLIASGLLALQVGGFYWLQRRGLFSKLMRTVTRFAGNRDWSRWLTQAEAIDLAVPATYERAAPVVSFLLTLVGGGSARARCI